MNIKDVLSELGLSDGEIKVYLALLKLGSSPVSLIKEESQLHRTTIYDFIEKLLNKGLVNYIVSNNTKFYKATEPEKLNDFLLEKQKKLAEVMPELKKLHNFQKEETKVEIYKGKEGLKSVLNICLRSSSEVLGIGIDDGLYKKHLPIYIEQFQRQLKEKNIKERIISKTDAEYFFNPKQTTYKLIPNDYFSPTSTLLYGNKLQIVLWEPNLMTLLIENKQLVEAYKKHFETLWNQDIFVFKGEKNVKSVFNQIIEDLKQGGKYLAFGIPVLPQKWQNFFKDFQYEIDKNNINARIILDERDSNQLAIAKKLKYVKTKKMAKEFMTLSEVNIYNNKVIMVLWSKIPQAIVIENQEIANSFRQYFEFMWKTSQKN